MIAFKVSVNGKRIYVAGRDDLAVLHAMVIASGKLGKKTVPARPEETTADIFYQVGGLTSGRDPEKDVHLRWKSNSPLKVGDVIQVTVVETAKVDRPKSRRPAAEARARAWAKARQKGLRKKSGA